MVQAGRIGCRGPPRERGRDGQAHLDGDAPGTGRRRASTSTWAWTRLPADGCVAVLHEVRDPGNAGTVLRSADAAGAGGVVFTETSVDVYNPKTVRASAGSLFHLPVVREVDDGGRDRPSPRRRTIGSSRCRRRARATSTTRIWRGRSPSCSATRPTGCPTEVVGRADAVVRVPHAGRAESLNLAAAATVCLFEWARRRRRTPGARPSRRSSPPPRTTSARPLTAMKGFGYAPREALGHHDRRAARHDAPGDRVRRRPDGHDRPPARRRGAARGGAASSSSPSRSTSRSSSPTLAENRRPRPRPPARRVARRGRHRSCVDPAAPADHVARPSSRRRCGGRARAPSRSRPSATAGACACA